MTQTAHSSTPPGKQMLSEQVYAHLRDAIMRGDHSPGAPSSRKILPRNRA